MDVIRFVVERGSGNGARHYPTVNIYINERNLLNILYWVERDNRLRLGEALGDSGYIGIPLRYLVEGPRAHFFEARRDGNWIRWLLACTCSQPECLGVLGRIAVYTDTIHWSDICNTWLADPKPVGLSVYALKQWKPYDYSSIRPFVFDRAQYEKALDALDSWSRC